MLNNYQTPPLEQKINELYQSHGITEPSHLSIELLAKKFNIWVHYHNKRSKGIEVSRDVYSIFLDSRLPVDTQRLEFLHELCHMLRHAGNQIMMPEQFTKAQETEADRFVFYAAVPFFMIKKVSLPSNKGEAIGYIAREFKVPFNFAKKRFEQIEDRIRQGEFLSAFDLVAVSREIILESAENYITQISSDRAEVHIKAYYNWDGDCSRPDTLVIEQPNGFDWDSPLNIEVDGNYESCDLPPYLPRESATVLSGDLSVPSDRKGYVTINLSRVSWRHGTAVSRLYLPMEAIEDAINF
ncbi:ImmA/IrrE family metallo-endopeptidase [Paenibacillus sp. 19GGS1-52]|uniref:ImmA/IrrE family metallo-endopeptidase n=1 Tax=Paenibacillus sp. 19GGS1-52 TaxID=2758563 RepID=UPI001EFB9759|nr:ImmA/IrrE family metallo-endopeptidase [Paenibacillus sp. 19GGS1-52]ULO08905.1 ImmA/IrrE family metallo-endopeptidase [Paenibacillus sp. 19GGS1-52]